MRPAITNSPVAEEHRPSIRCSGRCTAPGDSANHELRGGVLLDLQPRTPTRLVPSVQALRNDTFDTDAGQGVHPHPGILHIARLHAEHDTRSIRRAGDDELFQATAALVQTTRSQIVTALLQQVKDDVMTRFLPGTPPRLGPTCAVATLQRAEIKPPALRPPNDLTIQHRQRRKRLPYRRGDLRERILHGLTTTADQRTAPSPSTMASAR
nr:hypothetical protein [Phytoactinopolyspora halotolerans]